MRQSKLTRMVFGGRNRARLGASFLLSRRARVTVVVTRAGKRVAKITRKRARARKVQHVHLKGRRFARRGVYRVRITAGRGKSAQRSTLYSRRL